LVWKGTNQPDQDSRAIGDPSSGIDGEEGIRKAIYEQYQITSRRGILESNPVRLDPARSSSSRPAAPVAGEEKPKLPWGTEQSLV
jgi:hypothetical protein